MSYDEHLISMAGGDGEPDLDAIQARADDCQSYRFGMVNADKLAHDDVPALLALVREQRAVIERVRAVPPIEYGVDDNHHFPNGYNAAIAGVRAAITATEAGE